MPEPELLFLTHSFVTREKKEKSSFRILTDHVLEIILVGGVWGGGC